MSEVGPSVDWAVSLGSILGIVVSISVVAAAAIRIVGYLKKKITGEAETTRKQLVDEIDSLKKYQKITAADFNAIIEDKVKAGDRRYEEVKYWLHTLQETSERKDQDIEKKMEVHRLERNQKVADMQKTLEIYRQERNDRLEQMEHKLEDFRQERNERLALMDGKIEDYRTERNERFAAMEKKMEPQEGYIAGAELRRWLGRIEEALAENKLGYEQLRKQYYELSVSVAKMDKKVNGNGAISSSSTNRNNNSS